MRCQQHTYTSTTDPRRTSSDSRKGSFSHKHSFSLCRASQARKRKKPAGGRKLSSEAPAQVVGHSSGVNGVWGGSPSGPPQAPPEAGPPQAPIFWRFFSKLRDLSSKFSSKIELATSSLTAQHLLVEPSGARIAHTFLLPLNLRQSLLARCWRCRPQYCDCSSLACRAASICCASHAAASSKAAPPLSGATKFSHCLHEHVSCLARRTIRARRVRAED